MILKASSKTYTIPKSLPGLLLLNKVHFRESVLMPWLYILMFQLLNWSYLMIGYQSQERKVTVCYEPLMVCYMNYQLSRTWQSFSDEVLALKLWCCHWQLSLFPVETISTAMHRLHFHSLCNAKADKLLLETELVVHFIEPFFLTLSRSPRESLN